MTVASEINAGKDDLDVSWSDDSSILHLVHVPQQAQVTDKGEGVNLLVEYWQHAHLPFKSSEHTN